MLSIAAAKLGFAPILAVDNEEDAVETARANARVNGAEVTVVLADALSEELPASDVAVANIAFDVVERLIPRLDARLAIVSGYLHVDTPRVTGWRRVDRRDREGWAADLLERI